MSDYVAVYVRPDRPGHLKWATIKKELTAFNDAALRLGLQRPGLVTDNPWLRRLHYRAGRSAATRQQQHAGITVRVARGIFERHAGVGRLGRGRSVARAVALLLGYFFLLRPSELFGLTWSRVRFGRRRRDGSWKSTDATRAEVILLLVRHTKIARTIMHCRWPSGLAYFCPVRAMSFWWAWSWTAHLARSSPTTFGGRPLFPNAGGAPFAEWLGREAAGLGLAGLNAYSLRVGGAQHLKAHLDPGLSHDALRWAGVWADDAMANYYGGRSIEAFRSHARLMVQPTAVLPRF